MSQQTTFIKTQWFFPIAEVHLIEGWIQQADFSSGRVFLFVFLFRQLFWLAWMIYCKVEERERERKGGEALGMNLAISNAPLRRLYIV